MDKNAVQWIELNRGCKRQCAYCYADPNFKEFPVPEIVSNQVQIIGEGFLFDSRLPNLLAEMGAKRFNGRVIYYGVSQGIDRRLLTPELAMLLKTNRFGVINNKGNWFKGMRISWDDYLVEVENVRIALDVLSAAGYARSCISIFILVNWLIPYESCLLKLEKIRGWGVCVDDCTWNTTKREMQPHHWTMEQLKDFRKQVRKHNQLIKFRGYDPEYRRKIASSHESHAPSSASNKLSSSSG